MMRILGLAFMLSLYWNFAARALAIDTEPDDPYRQCCDVLAVGDVAVWADLQPRIGLDIETALPIQLVNHEGNDRSLEIIIAGQRLDLSDADAGEASAALFRKLGALLPEAAPVASRNMKDVPVPAALPLLLSGIAGLGYMALRRRSGSAAN